MQKINVNRKHKDKLFRTVFREKKDLLALYNALNGTDYTNEDDLKITTLDDVVYMGMKNDTSFIIDHVMNLYEHQSTLSPNLPLRGLLYFADLYRAHIEPVKRRLYSESPLLIPTPQYVVFYNGTKEQPERKELHLSDLFIQKGNFPCLECTAVVLNINLGHNRELMEKCSTLKQYAQFVACVRDCVQKHKNYETGTEKAVDYCIENGILSELLLKNKSEVVNMILTEFDEEDYREFLREEARDRGLAEGRAEGIAEGRAEGIAEGRAEGLIILCKDFHLSYEETLTKLIEKLSLNPEKAKEYLKHYWNQEEN